MPRTSQDDSALSIVITSVKRFQETTLRSSFARSPIVLPSFSHFQRRTDGIMNGDMTKKEWRECLKRMEQPTIKCQEIIKEVFSKFLLGID